MFLIFLSLLTIGLILLISGIPESPKDLTKWQMIRVAFGVVFVFFSVGICGVIDDNYEYANKHAHKGYLSPVTIMETGTSYDLITSGELEAKDGKTTYWLIIKDHDGQFRALTSDEKPPTSSKVVMMSDQENDKNVYHLLPYEEKAMEEKPLTIADDEKQ